MNPAALLAPIFNRKEDEEMSTGKMEITPSKMAEMGNNLANSAQDYSANVKSLFSSLAQMSSMWEGAAHDTFMSKMNAAAPSFQDLYAMITEYANAVVSSAQTYLTGEENVKNIVSKL
jgi:WXG100 family type VII secretion target